MKKYKVFSKTSANRYHVAYKKSKKDETKKKETNKKSVKTDKKSEPVCVNRLEIDIDSSKSYKINESLKNQYKVRFIELVSLMIKDDKFYYNPETNEVHDLTFKKIGIYENEKLIFNGTQ